MLPLKAISYQNYAISSQKPVHRYSLPDFIYKCKNFLIGFLLNFIIRQQMNIKKSGRQKFYNLSVFWYNASHYLFLVNLAQLCFCFLQHSFYKCLCSLSKLLCIQSNKKFVKLLTRIAENHPLNDK